jgi:VWFA-related protein
VPWRGIAVLFPLLFSVAAAFAQTHREQITVRVVEVPVYVERQTGGSVLGLTKDDFELYVNGAPQPIHYFDALDGSTTRSGNSVASLHRRRLVVLLFDLGSPAWAVWRQKDAAAKFVTEAPPGDTFAVATVGRAGVRFIMPFSTDRVAVQRAIGTFATSAARDPLNLATLDVERSAWSRSGSGGAETASGSFLDIWGESGVKGVALVDSRSAQSITTDMLQMQELEEQEADRQDRALIDSLGALADRLAPLSGIKHVVLLSAGSIREVQSDTLQAIMRMHARYRSAGVILDVVDQVSARAPWPGAEGTRFGPNPGLYALALDTGGMVTTSLATLQKTHEVTYVLGFRPQGPQKNRNEIVVRVKNVPWGTFVRYQHGYALDFEPRSSSGDGLLLADVLMNDIPQNGVTVDVAVKAERDAAQVAASVPGRELLALGSDKPILFDVFLYVFNDRNLVAGWTYARVSLDLEKGRDFLSSNAYTVRKGFSLRPGHYSAKALVRFVGANLTGFRRADFDVTGR